MGQTNKLKEWVIDPLLPPRCPVSGDIVDHDAVLSPGSWAGLSFLSKPVCKSCGTPFAFENKSAGFSKDNEMLCLGCLRKSPYFDSARAALAYNETSRRLLLSFKYGDQHQSARLLAGFAGRMIKKPDSYHAIIPVPLHKHRLIQRRFNQSALLAQWLARLKNIPYSPFLLQRSRATPPQKDKNRKQRQKNVKNAFMVPDKIKDQIPGSHLIIIDDVFTTGATVNECARVLKIAGAEKVDVVTIARVVNANHAGD